MSVQYLSILCLSSSVHWEASMLQNPLTHAAAAPLSLCLCTSVDIWLATFCWYVWPSASQKHATSARQSRVIAGAGSAGDAVKKCARESSALERTRASRSQIWVP